LYNIVEDHITCPLRDDIVCENESRDEVFWSFLFLLFYFFKGFDEYQKCL